MAARNVKKTVIRNSMWVPQNLRFGDDKKDKVELNRRGERGDVASITEEQKDTTAFKMGLNRFFEVITQSEADKILYADEEISDRFITNPVTGERMVEVGIVSEQDNTIGAKNIYTDPRTGKIYQRTGPVGPRVANVPGSDPYYAAANAQAQGAPVPGVNSVEMPLPEKGRTDTPIEKKSV